MIIFLKLNVKITAHMIKCQNVINDYTHKGKRSKKSSIKIYTIVVDIVGQLYFEKLK